jgi:hypothetical protein
MDYRAFLAARDPRFKDFRNFLYHVWKGLGLPDPTPVQYQIAYWMQHGDARIVLEAYRGVGKSWITAAFVVWNLYWDPDKKILIVSGAKRYADDMSTFILQIIRTVDGLAWLDCEGRERHSKIAFDVGPAAPHKQPSVTSTGITGQLTGSRAHLIVADDIETLSNALTQTGRDKISVLIQEFDAIVLPGGRIVYLGTPQTEQSIYTMLPGRGYTVRIWPAHFPDLRLQMVQGLFLAPEILEAVREDPTLIGQPTDPTRFSAEDLAAREASYGRSGYAMQFKLDTSLSDIERYPLKLRDLIVYPCQDDLFPTELQWAPDPSRAIQGVVSIGMGTDRLYHPVVPAGVRTDPFSGCAMFVDPAGSGTDETAYAIARHSHGRICVPEATGLSHTEGGFSDTIMVTLAQRALRFRVNIILVESNFGDGMFEKLLQPHVARVFHEAGLHPPSIEPIKSTFQKERRIIDVLEPLMNQHRLVIDQSVFEKDGYRSSSLPAEKAPRYLLQYQMTRLTSDRGCLAHDDRLDALAGVCTYWMEQMARDVNKSVAAAGRKLIEAEEKDWGLSVWGVGKEPKKTTILAGNAGIRGRVGLGRTRKDR